MKLEALNTALSIAIAMIVIIGCQNMEPDHDGFKTTTSGFKYSLVKDRGGAAALPGQYALVDVVLSYKDTVLSDTRLNPGKPNVVKIESDKEKLVGLTIPIQEILQLMSVGDSAILNFPVDAFPSPPEQLKKYDEVTYALSVVKIFKTEEEYQKYVNSNQDDAASSTNPMEAQIAEKMTAFYDAYAKGEKTDAWTTTSSGLKYIILEKGGTGRKPQKGEFIAANYYGLLADTGKMFDSSYKRGRIVNFAVGKGGAGIMKGWDEGLQLMEKGDKAVFLMPSELAYGSQGIPDYVPPDANLIFYIDLLDIGVME
jgi:FKBP-type peptidyl-prolyl cis-trans isomerase